MGRSASRTVSAVTPRAVRERMWAKYLGTIGVIGVVTLPIVLALFPGGSERSAALTAWVVLMAFGTLAMVIVGRDLLTSVADLEAKAAELDDGNLDVDIRTRRVDEIGRLQASLDGMRRSIREQVDEAKRLREDAERARRETEAMNDHFERKAAEFGEVMEATADGDLTRRLDPESRSDAITRIATAVNGTLDDIERTVAEAGAFADDVRRRTGETVTGAVRMRETTEEVADATTTIADEVRELSTDLARVSEEAGTLSTAIEEIASSADRVSENASTSAEVGAAARANAEETMEAIEEIKGGTTAAVSTMWNLSDEMERVESIVDGIESIAGQTNLLALNASIEAARAGEAGEGFAVVADEVKQLAQEAENETERIREVVAAVQETTDETVEEIEAMTEQVSMVVGTVEESVSALSRVADEAEAVSAGVQDIKAATEEQADSTDSVVSTVERIDATSRRAADEAETVTDAVEDHAESIATVGRRADGLADRADDLLGVLDEFEVDADLDVGAEAGATGPGEAERNTAVGRASTPSVRTDGG